MNISRQVTVFSLTTMLSAGLAHAEKCNFFKKAPAIEVSFTLILFGDVSADIDATATENDPLVDPFTYVNQHQQSSYCGLHTCASTVTVTVIGPANNRETKVVFNGTNPIQPSYTYSYGGGTNPHFGLDSPANSDFPKFQIASEQWQSGSQASAISVKPPAPGKGTVKYEIIFATSTSGSDSSGAWYELPYTGATAPLPNFANYGYQPVTLSNVGYQLSPTLIPLDNLNFGDYPPPGQSNSGFTPLPQFDGSTFNGTPEPSMLLPMAAAAAVLARRRKRQSV